MIISMASWKKAGETEQNYAFINFEVNTGYNVQW